MIPCPAKVASLSFALYQQNNPTDGQDGPGERAVGNIVSRFLGGVDRPDIQNLVACFESEIAPNDYCDATTISRIAGVFIEVSFPDGELRSCEYRRQASRWGT